MADNSEFVVVSQARFREVVPAGAMLEKLAGGFRFTEGPVWSSADGGFLLFSDIPANRILRWSRTEGISVFREPSEHANGNFRDHLGRLLTCEHGTRRVTRTEPEGPITILADSYQGKRLNSPNDLVVRSDGTIWFTDPPYGLPQQSVGKQLDRQHVFRLDPRNGQFASVADDFDRPNGLCFSPDEKRLYIADSSERKHIRVFDVSGDGALTGGAVFCNIDAGVPDGIRTDTAGRLYSSAADGMHVFDPDGALIGRILVPESPANLCFGAQNNSTLFITARTSLYAIRLQARGAVEH